MKLNERTLKRHIKNYNIKDREEVIEFIQENPENLNVDELSRIAELINNSRLDTAAYYTDTETLLTLEQHLPDIDKKTIRILEPSVGVGNFLQIIINKYAKVAEKVIIDVNDIDEYSVVLTKLLNNYRYIPGNVEINYYVEDFLFSFLYEKFDLIIGNPPFLKLNKKKGLIDYAENFNDYLTSNISGFFLQKATDIGDNVILIMPKYFLSNKDFKETRNRVKKYSIDKIIDFGEKGFKGVLIETIGLFINTLQMPNKTLTYSVTKNLCNTQRQSLITSDNYPYWLIYRNDFFNKVASKMKFDVFSVFRDRQLTNSVLKNTGSVQVIKSRNINRDGSGLTSINGYDKFIDFSELNKYAISKYFNRDDVYLAPNMTYYPRVIKKPQKTVTNGSVAILENVSKDEISNEQLEFLCSTTFEKFYQIARNYSTRSLNIDSNSVYFFGLLQGKLK